MCACLYSVCVTTCHHYPHPTQTEELVVILISHLAEETKTVELGSSFPSQSTNLDLHNWPIHSHIFPFPLPLDFFFSCCALLLLILILSK